MWIHVGRATINNTLDFDKFSSLAFCGYFAFISIRKEAIKIIQCIQSLEMMLYQLTKFSFLGNWSHANLNLLRSSCDLKKQPALSKWDLKNMAGPTKWDLKNVASPFLMGFQKSGQPFPNGNFKKVVGHGFTFLSGQCAAWWNNVLRFELKKLSDLDIYIISITHNLKDNNFNTYLYLWGGSS